MCNCLFPYFPLCTDTTELCLNDYLLLLCFQPILVVLLSCFPSSVTSIFPDFGLAVGRSPSIALLRRGQCSRGAGAQDGVGSGGTWEAARRCLRSRMVTCCLSHILLFGHCPLKETPVFQRPTHVVRLCLAQDIIPATSRTQFLPICSLDG